MSIKLSDNILVRTTAPTDSRYGPYENTTIESAKSDALSAIDLSYRYKGLSVGLIVNGSTTEYWFKDGITDNDLVEKSGSNVDISGKVDIIDNSLTGIYVLTQAEYDAIQIKEPKVLYVIKSS